MLLSRFEDGAENGLSDWKVWDNAGGVYDGTSEVSVSENGYGGKVE